MGWVEQAHTKMYFPCCKNNLAGPSMIFSRVMLKVLVTRHQMKQVFAGPSEVLAAALIAVCAGKVWSTECRMRSADTIQKRNEATVLLNAVHFESCYCTFCLFSDWTAFRQS